MERLLSIIQKHWGYSSLRPLQQEAMTAALAGRDSLVVLPTGGGKSLCYQAPAILTDRLTVVVSPLIALMKDQVDRLIERGINAAFLNSSLDPEDRRLVAAGVRGGAFRLLFVAPERFTNQAFLDLLSEVRVGAFAIDEAHCISHWGHDFRQEYRSLGRLKETFAGTPIHAFTATATPRVRQDIIAQLGLTDPEVLVGDFFRPNLRYSVEERLGEFEEVCRCVLDRRDSPGIVYCIRRVDVDVLSGRLQESGVCAEGYHAGMSDDDRTRVQDAFAAGRVNVVVATVAFGMGIDRSDIRYVIHAAMPKSIEHYQQETGRAGRDGKPAECILFYSGADYGLWRSIIEAQDSASKQDQLRLLSEMYRYCGDAACRHRRLVAYFGQQWKGGKCQACDVCAGGLPVLADATVMAQKIMSCVVRTGQHYGASYVADVLMGTASDRVVQRGHEALSTFGLVSDRPKSALTSWMTQLVDQGMLRQSGEYSTLSVTDQGWAVLRGEAEAELYLPPAARPSQKTKGKKRRNAPARKSKAPVPKEKAAKPAIREDLHMSPEVKGLYEGLRVLRKAIAGELGVPAFMVFSDKTLRAMARARPTTRESLLQVHGVGPAKCNTYGRRFMELIRLHSVVRAR